MSAKGGGMVFSWFLYFLFFATMHDSSCLSMERLEVPALAKLFHPVKIACRYRLGSLRLESVKWYKDEDEFFRFTPSERPKTRMFNISGIEVDMEKSDMHVVSLVNVSISSAGVYRCEVSSDSPAFETVQESKIMDVFYQPDKKPQVFIEKTEIQPNEDIVAQCVTGKSFPVQNIFWFLNGIQINKKCIKKDYVITDDNGLLTKYSCLRVRARGGPGPILVSCVGSQGKTFFPERSHVELTLSKYSEDDPIAQRGSADCITQDFKRCIRLAFLYVVIPFIQ
ncbi:unnamed protein product [Nezara viridula]|uniref:Ig-like domain-containing protein n=1 Tax=Nezara viridula TaxID=85310 RepID=A0A9P0E6C4_NEZVI|nr:unnamed protein product [Nezara viridula]